MVRWRVLLGRVNRQQFETKSQFSALKEAGTEDSATLLDGLTRPTACASAITDTAQGERTVGRGAVSGDPATKLQANWEMPVQEGAPVWPTQITDFAVPWETAQARGGWHLEHTEPLTSEDDMTKMLLLGAAALVTGTFVFSAPDSTAKLSACDVNGRGEAIAWAKQNPGVAYREVCQGLNGG